MMTSELSTGKTIFILAVVVGCFAILWPKVFYPMLTASVKSSATQQAPPQWRDPMNAHQLTQLCFLLEEQRDPSAVGFERWSEADCFEQIKRSCKIVLTERLLENFRLYKDKSNLTECLRQRYDLTPLKVSAAAPPPTRTRPYQPYTAVHPHVRPERPSHLHPEVMHPALREKGRTMPQRTIEKEARPGPMPGLRPPMGGGGHMVPPQTKGSGAMGVIMPLYTVGIVIFFIYTIMKVLFKKNCEEDKTPKLKDFHMDPEYRKYVFAEEYLDSANASHRDLLRRQERESSRQRRRQEVTPPDTKIGKPECEQISSAISLILADLDMVSKEVEARKEALKEELETRRKEIPTKETEIIKEVKEYVTREFENKEVKNKTEDSLGCCQIDQHSTFEETLDHITKCHYQDITKEITNSSNEEESACHESSNVKCLPGPNEKSNVSDSKSFKKFTSNKIPEHCKNLQKNLANDNNDINQGEISTENSEISAKNGETIKSKYTDDYLIRKKSLLSDLRSVDNSISELGLADKLNMSPMLSSLLQSRHTKPLLDNGYINYEIPGCSCKINNVNNYPINNSNERIHANSSAEDVCTCHNFPEIGKRRTSALNDEHQSCECIIDERLKDKHLNGERYNPDHFHSFPRNENQTLKNSSFKISTETCECEDIPPITTFATCQCECIPTSIIKPATSFEGKNEVCKDFNVFQQNLVVDLGKTSSYPDEVSKIESNQEQGVKLSKRKSYQDQIVDLTNPKLHQDKNQLTNAPGYAQDLPKTTSYQEQIVHLLQTRSIPNQDQIVNLLLTRSIRTQDEFVNETKAISHKHQNENCSQQNDLIDSNGKSYLEGPDTMPDIPSMKEYTQVEPKLEEPWLEKQTQIKEFAIEPKTNLPEGIDNYLSDVKMETESKSILNQAIISNYPKSNSSESQINDGQIISFIKPTSNRSLPNDSTSQHLIMPSDTNTIKSEETCTLPALSYPSSNEGEHVNILQQKSHKDTKAILQQKSFNRDVGQSDQTNKLGGESKTQLHDQIACDGKAQSVDRIGNDSKSQPANLLGIVSKSHPTDHLFSKAQLVDQLEIVSKELPIDHIYINSKTQTLNQIDNNSKAQPAGKIDIVSKVHQETTNPVEIKLAKARGRRNRNGARKSRRQKRLNKILDNNIYNEAMGLDDVMSASINEDGAASLPPPAPNSTTTTTHTTMTPTTPKAEEAALIASKGVKLNSVQAQGSSNPSQATDDEEPIETIEVDSSSAIVASSFLNEKLSTNSSKTNMKILRRVNMKENDGHKEEPSMVEGRNLNEGSCVEELLSEKKKQTQPSTDD